jgi:hypothetical protein
LIMQSGMGKLYEVVADLRALTYPSITKFIKCNTLKFSSFTAIAYTHCILVAVISPIIFRSTLSFFFVRVAEVFI